MLNFAEPMEKRQNKANDISIEIKQNQRQKMDGIALLQNLKEKCAKAIFFDPQYRGILDKQKYGNEGTSKEKRRCELTQMSEETIQEFIFGI